ncbi:methylthioribulose-1-phosphate dehydratase [Striga asiatica]|uniref:Methylthioribulose-1-phosphate dehydratase n=1 Tax=Striga asiatica TaxID=4170 RepID=A0A5A7Q2V3_STRAF|nr:methylthioribulose-1-phosphate dehydratase [Striga asiatica]
MQGSDQASKVLGEQAKRRTEFRKRSFPLSVMSYELNHCLCTRRCARFSSRRPQFRRRRRMGTMGTFIQCSYPFKYALSCQVLSRFPEVCFLFDLTSLVSSVKNRMGLGESVLRGYLLDYKSEERRGLVDVIEKEQEKAATNCLP